MRRPLAFNGINALTLREKVIMNDLAMLGIAAGFAAGSWLLLVLCHRLMGGKP
jgi:hypothetical protein